MTFVPRRAADLTIEKLFAAAGLEARFTDLNPGSVVRSLFEAVSIVEEELDHATFVGILDGIAEQLYTAFDFARLPGIPATGVVRFFKDPVVPSAIVIPAGTVVASPATAREPVVEYQTIDEATIDADQGAIDVKVRAFVSGTVGNAPAGAVSLLQQSLFGITAVSNPAAILSGLDEETDRDRRVRFAQWVRDLRGGTLGGLEANARTVVLTNDEGTPVERVDRAQAVHSYVAGRVDLYIDNGGGDASTALIAKVQAHLDGGYTEAGERIIGYVSGGIVLRVFGTIGVAVPVTGRLKIEPGYAFATVRTAVVEAVTLYLYGLGVFTEMIYADLLGIIVQVEGVHDVELTVPTGNRAPSFEERLLPGLITLTEWT